ncbi:TRAP transporter large permease subunit [Alisedimentitalea sp. MJ-SS2]|uniref:TRAP transporter large permease n=1 Tax=Aliisedimentitalea sp. MJ-SS2 TaxID=3049795 RepID=UPI0029139F77|nr:TRAP transporter large permease subunit [Alisedimentitalea sp. MJ-SS2]MDU8927655.1 TRAP transporter large permease subunit [Alisedimentitalea sp. MJ-SS2]
MELFFLALLVVIMAGALGSGYPVAFALPGAAIITIVLAGLSGYLFTGSADAFFHSGGPQQWLSAGTLNLRGVYWEVERDTLIAIPLFIFMGIMLQRSKIAEDLLVTMAKLFGPVPGGLGISVVFVGALLAATTGIVGATVVAMGLISLPAMLRNNYSPSLATGTIAASGTLGQIIPPSIVLIILADQLASATDQAGTARKALHKSSTGELSMPSSFDVASTSAGEMFLGAFVPGILLVLLYMAYILIYALINPKAAPAVHAKGESTFDRKFWGQVFLTLVPPLTLIFLVLGSIITGVATVNQAGAIGAAGALIMAGYRLYEGNKKLTYVPALLALASLGVMAFLIKNFDMNLKSASSAEDWMGITVGVIAASVLMFSLIWSGWRVLRIERTMHGVMLETAKTTSLVFIILLGAAMLTAAFRAFGGEELVREFLNGLPGGFWTQFVIVMAVIFILGFFLDFIEIAVVVVPIVAPILLMDPSANITAVWLGVMIGLNIQTSFLTPPFGFALFYLRGVAPSSVKTTQMYKGVIAFITLQLLALGIVGAYPPLVNYLPNRVSLLSETAPPPVNPKLQYCIEEYTGTQLASGADPKRAIDRIRALDISTLPKDLQKDLTKGYDNADKALENLAIAFESEQKVIAASDEYRPLQRTVRKIEKDVRKLEEEADELKKFFTRLNSEETAARRARLEAEREELLVEAKHLLETIPENWDEAHKTFAELTTAEQKARQMYRRQVDGAWEAPSVVLAVLADNEAFNALEGELTQMRGYIETVAEGDESAEDTLKALEAKFGAVEGAGDVKKALGKARRALKPKKFDREKALKEFDKSTAEFAEQKAWRAEAAGLAPDLQAYLEDIRGTLGIRSQRRLDRDQALYMASCNAKHRDISLNF